MQCLSSHYWILTPLSNIWDCLGISSSNLGEKEELFETIHSVQGGQMHVESYLPKELHVAVGMMLPGRFTNEFFVCLVCCLGVLQKKFRLLYWLGVFTTEFVVCCIVFEEQLFLCKIKILPDICKRQLTFYCETNSCLCSIQALPTLQSHTSLTWQEPRFLHRKDYGNFDY